MHKYVFSSTSGNVSQTFPPLYRSLIIAFSSLLLLLLLLFSPSPFSPFFLSFFFWFETLLIRLKHDPSIFWLITKSSASLSPTLPFFLSPHLARPPSFTLVPLYSLRFSISSIRFTRLNPMGFVANSYSYSARAPVWWDSFIIEKNIVQIPGDRERERKREKERGRGRLSKGDFERRNRGSSGACTKHRIVLKTERDEAWRLRIGEEEEGWLRRSKARWDHR